MRLRRTPNAPSEKLYQKKMLGARKASQGSLEGDGIPSNSLKSQRADERDAFPATVLAPFFEQPTTRWRSSANAAA